MESSATASYSPIKIVIFLSSHGPGANKGVDDFSGVDEDFEVPEWN